MTEPASFLGIACEGMWEVVIVEEALWPAATHGVRSGSVRNAHLHDLLAGLRKRAELEDRDVVAWSTRELDEIESTFADGSPAADWWQANLINALPLGFLDLLRCRAGKHGPLRPEAERGSWTCAQSSSPQ